MYTSGLVLTLVDDPELAAAAVAELSAGPFIFGDASGRCRAVVLEAADPGAAHDWHDWAAARPGVTGVEVVFVHWDEAEQEASHAGA